MEERYHRQELLSFWDQQRIESFKPLVVGCGGLGSHILAQLVRAGVVDIVVADSDNVEISNLHRVTLYHQHHADEGISKVQAATSEVLKINDCAQIKAEHVKVSQRNIEQLAYDRDLIFDASDNLALRYVINTYCVNHHIPWIYGGAVGCHAMVMPVLPEGPCFQCAFPNKPSDEELPDSRTVGIHSALPALVASWQVIEGFKWLFNQHKTPVSLITIDFITNHYHTMVIPRDPHCTVCGE